MKLIKTLMLALALSSTAAIAEYKPVTLVPADTVVDSIKGPFNFGSFNSFLVKKWFGHERLEKLVAEANQNLTRIDQLVTALNDLKGDNVPFASKYTGMVTKLASIETNLQTIVDKKESTGKKRKELSRFYRQARAVSFDVVKESVAVFQEAVDYSRVAIVQETNRLQRKIPDHLVFKNADGSSSEVTLADGLNRMLQNTEDLAVLAKQMKADLDTLETEMTKVEESQARIEAKIDEDFSKLSEGQAKILTDLETLLAKQAEDRANEDAQFVKVLDAMSAVSAKIDALAADLDAKLADLRLEVLVTKLDKYHYVRMNETTIEGAEGQRLVEFVRGVEEGVYELESRGLTVQVQMKIRSMNDVVASDNVNRIVAAKRVARVEKALQHSMRSDTLALTQIEKLPYDQSKVARHADRGVEIQLLWVISEKK